MLRFLFILYSLCFIQLCTAQISGTVVSVADGDTFTILTKCNRQVKIRLHGIDCPEKRQDFGNKAKQYTSNAVFGKFISVDSADKDRYGRVIAIVPLDGTTLNEMLLRNGLAWHYCKYDKNEYWHKVQDSANAQKIGIWSRPDVVAPWVYRKLN